jgi:hypothetical protein
MTGKLQNTSKSSEKIIKIEEFWKNKEISKTHFSIVRPLKVPILIMFSDFFKTALRDEQQGVSHDPNIGSNEIKYVDNDFLYYYTWKFIFNYVFDVQANSP